MRTFFLFVFIITGTLINAQKNGLTFNKTISNHGQSNYFTGRIDSFLVTNTSKKPIYVFITTKDKALTYKLPKKALQVNESAYIQIIYKVRKKGRYKVKVPVFSGGSSNPTNLIIQGEILAFDPNYEQSCPSFSRPKNQNTLDFQCQVVVLDDQTSLPIDGAQVKIYKGNNSQLETTGRKGILPLRLRMGVYYLQVGATGYISTDKDHYFGNNSTQVVFRLKREALIKEDHPLLADRIELRDSLIEEQLVLEENNLNDQWEEETEIVPLESNLNEQPEDITEITNNLNEQEEEYPEITNNLNDQEEDSEPITEVAVIIPEVLEEPIIEVEQMEEEVLIINETEEISEEVTEDIDEFQNFSYNDYAKNNLVFLVDVSKSMGKENRLEYLKTTMNHLVDLLRPEDYITILSYASETNLLLSQVSAGEKERIHAVINGLESGGSTEGGKAIKQAFQVAKSRYIEHGNNQIILSTDGGFNGLSESESSLKNYIRVKTRISGIAFSILCIRGSVKDRIMLKNLADVGTGNFIFVKSEILGVQLLEEEIRSRSKR